MTRSRFTYPLSLAAIVLVLDQCTKFWVQASLAQYESVEIIPGFFNLVHVLNRGAAFGFLNQDDISWQRPFFVAVALAASFVVIHLIRGGQAREWFSATGLGLILGGALGNLVDRVRLGLVVDFLDFFAGGWHWPAFNVADMGISVGVTLLLISFYITDRGQRRRPKE
ncbi:signal peptidase II [Desulfocurvus sp. DL9XJH121]